MCVVGVEGRWKQRERWKRREVGEGDRITWQAILYKPNFLESSSLCFRDAHSTDRHLLLQETLT